MHEISHNLLFKKVFHNKLFGVFTNLFTIFPHFTIFQRYHMDHHIVQGYYDTDADLPSEFEGHFFRTPFLKAVWIFFQPVFYIIRPLLKQRLNYFFLKIKNILIKD